MHNRQKQILIVAILLSVALRVAAAFLLGSQVEDLPGTADQISYHTLALRLLDGYGFTFGEAWWPATPANTPTAHWSYLYTGYLALVYALFGPHPLAARLIQAALAGVFQPLLAYLVGRQIFGRRVGLAAALLTAVYAYFVYYAANLMTETFYIIAILASFYLAIKLASRPDIAPQDRAPASSRVRSELSPPPAPHPRQATSHTLKLAVFLGLTLGAAVLLRQLFLLFIPFIFLWILLSGRKQLVPLLVSGMILVLLILPFTLYNYIRFDRFVLLNTNAGFAFYWGNHPIYGNRFQSILPRAMGSYRDLLPEELIGSDEAAMDQALLRRGIQFVLDDPGRYVLLSISRIPAYFMFWPSSDSGMVSNIARVTSFGLLWPFMLYGVLFSLMRRPALTALRPPNPAILFYFFVLAYTIIHLLTWTLIRYRLPVDAILIIFAGLALVDLSERIPLLRRLAASTDRFSPTNFSLEAFKKKDVQP